MKLIMDKTRRQKISKEIEDVNNIIHQLDLTDMYVQNTPPKSAEHTHSS